MAKTIYIEVFDRIDSPTIVGKMCYLFADIFIVECEKMKKKLLFRQDIVGMRLRIVITHGGPSSFISHL